MKLADRMKMYEEQFNNKFQMNDGEILFSRIDGKCFHTYTKNMDRPYSSKLMELMRNTTKFLIDEFNCDLGYCQSDEISLCWLTPNKIMFDGRINKYNSVMASVATAFFNDNSKHISAELAFFDCRTWLVPSVVEGANYFFWRELDAIKNAITLVASSVYSHKQLLNKNSDNKVQMLLDKNIDFWRDYPNDFIRGQYFKKYLIEKTNEIGTFHRHIIKKCEFEYLQKMADKTTIFR